MHIKLNHVLFFGGTQIYSCMKTKFFLLLLICYLLIGCDQKSKNDNTYYTNLVKLISNSPDYDFLKVQTTSYLNNEYTNDETFRKQTKINKKEFNNDAMEYANSMVPIALANNYLSLSQEKISEKDLIEYLNVLMEPFVNSSYKKMYKILTYDFNSKLTEYRSDILRRLSQKKKPYDIELQPAPLIFLEISNTIYNDIIRIPVDANSSSTISYAKKAGVSSAEFSNAVNDVLDTNLPILLNNVLADNMTEEEISAVYKLLVETDIEPPMITAIPEEFLASCKSNYLLWRDNQNVSVITMQDKNATEKREKSIVVKRDPVKASGNNSKTEQDSQEQTAAKSNVKQSEPIHYLTEELNIKDYPVNGGAYIEVTAVIPAGTPVYPLYYLRANGKGEYSDAYVLCEDLAGNRFAVDQSKVSPDVSALQLKALNPDYHHYVMDDEAKDFIGMHISEVVKEWGDYTYSLKKTNNTKYYIFNHITLAGTIDREESPQLITDMTGVVIDKAVGNVSKNLFGILPFYDNILTINLLKGKMFFDDLDKFYNHGKESFLIMLLIYFVYASIYSLIAGIICFGLMHIKKIPNSAIKVLFVSMCVICGYILTISLMEHFHEIWILVFFSMGICLVCYYFSHRLIGLEKRCPKCNAINSVKTEKIVMDSDPYNIYCTFKFPSYSGGDPGYDLSITQKRYLSFRKECKKCKHLWWEEGTETLNITHCPDCGKSIKEGGICKIVFDDCRYERGSSNISLTFKYRCVVECSCGWHINIKNDGWDTMTVTRNEGNKRSIASYPVSSSENRPNWDNCVFARHDISFAPNRICRIHYNNHENFGTIYCDCHNCSDYKSR